MSKLRLIGSAAVLLLTMMVIPAQALEVGDKAPDFKLQATDGKTYRLSKLTQKHPVVLAWFPKAYTQGCTLECKSLAENGHLLKEFQVSYFMASVDPLETNKGFAEENKADFPLLSDPTKETAKAYEVLSDRGVAKRHTFYIGQDRRILAIDREVQPATSARDMAAMLEKLGVPKNQELSAD